MNQAIQVFDGYTYIQAKNAIKVDFMASGEILVCYISGSDKTSLTKLYDTKQFEIEEIIEQAVEEDKCNSDGEIWLTAEEVYTF